jgi:hypothetical protein
MAKENAIEGCVYETYSALLAAWQAARARDPEVAREMARVAADETRHAALAWAVSHWADTKLDARARARVGRAREAAFDSLENEVRDAPPSVTRAVGLPSSAEQRALVRALRRQLGVSAA